MKAIGFDLGNTLVEYAGVPLNWEQHYPAALRELAACLGSTASSQAIETASAVLRRYNTRLNPRESEVTFGAILAELLPCFDCSSTKIADATKPCGTGVPTVWFQDHRPEARAMAALQCCAEAFFRVFQQKLRPFPDAEPALAKLRQSGCAIGVFTDVPYAMPRELVQRDITAAGLDGKFDVLITSCEAGCRKPAAATLHSLADALGCAAAELSYVGDEEKDVAAARRFGCTAILLDRAGHGHDFGQDRTIRSLADL